MNTSLSSSSRLRAHAWAMVLVALMSACAEPPFAHTNPNDPEFQGTYSLTGGADTLSETWILFRLQLTGTPPLSPTIRVSWNSSHPRLHVDGRGEVFAVPTLRPTAGTVTATIGSRQAHRSFVMLQRAETIRTTCHTVVRCDTVDALGEQFAFSVEGDDVYGIPLLDIPFALGEAPSIVRDPSVLTQLAPIVEDRRRFTSLANGTTWVTIDLGDLRDSVRVVVRQRATNWTNLCPQTVEVGGSAHLRATDFKDRNGNPLAVNVLGPPPIEWEPGQALDVGASAIVEPSGLVTGVAAGSWLTTAVNPGYASIDCVINVVEP